MKAFRRGWTAFLLLTPGIYIVADAAAAVGRDVNSLAVRRQSDGATSAVTFTRDVAPILFEHCTPCHRPGGSAAFSLETFEEAKQHARQIATVTASRAMPPWKPDSAMGTFVGDRRLNDRQIGVFQSWLSGGLAKGDASDAPPTPQWPSGWQLGQPDLVLTMAQPYVLGASGPDMFRNFVIPVPLPEGRYVKAWEFHPGNARVVHHATLQIDALGVSRLRDQGEREPGFEGLIAPSALAPDGFFLDWAPGHRPNVAVDGTAWPLPARSDLVMMLHLRPSGKEEAVQASVGLYFSDGPPEKLPVMLRLTREDLDIPAGDANYEARDSYTLPVDVDLYTAQPHAHYLAREIRGVARLPGETRDRELIAIRDWDFNWQDVYTYVKPIPLPAGTTLSMQIVYDNSSANSRNPHYPAVRVTYGQQTLDEMAELWFQVVPHSAKDRATLVAGLRDKVRPAEISGRRMMVAHDPNSVALHNELALLYSDAGNGAAAAAEFARVLQLTPDSASAAYNLGSALGALGKRAEARSFLEQALERQPGRADAHFELGRLAQADGDYRAATTHYRQALVEQPDDPEVLFNLGVVLALTGDRDGGIGTLRRANALRPDWPAAMGSLAWVLAVPTAASEFERHDAIGWARRADELTGHSNAGILDILATALAANGEFDAAVTDAERAVALEPTGGGQGSGDPIAARLELFRRHAAYHEP